MIERQVEARHVADENWEEVANWSRCQVTISRSAFGGPPKIVLHLPYQNSGFVTDNRGEEVFGQRVDIGNWIVREWINHSHQFTAYSDSEFGRLFEQANV